ncbi:MAG: hypothetical protein K5829_12090 [Treponema sp.]|nr:hypothetical protein [Treponema sp.]
MKKSFLIFMLALLVSLFFISCATLPKTVEPGSALVIGRAESKVHGYNQFEDVDFKGRKLGNMEITVEEESTKKEFIVKTDEEGLFVITKCKPNHSYKLKTFKFTSASNSGAYRSVSVSFPNSVTFVAKENVVSNIGSIYIDFDGEANMASYQVKNHYYVKQSFLDLDEESEWLEKRIIDLR